MQVRWFDLDALPQRCLAAFAKAEERSPELGLDWFHNLADHALDAGTQVAFVEAHPIDMEQATTVLPVQFAEKRGKISSLANFYTALYEPVASGMDPGTGLTALFRNIQKQGWTSFWLSPMAREQALFDQTLSSFKAAGWLPFPFFCFGNWYLQVRGRTYEEYFQSLPSQTRNTVQRRGQKFQQSGKGRLELVTGGTGLETAIGVWTEVYSSSWKIPEPYPDFMPGLIRLCAAKGWLRMGIAYYGDEPIAAQVWIVNQGRAAIYKLAYNSAHAKHSAGTLLTDFLMRHVMDVDKVDEVDYMIGDDAYKKDWMDARRERWGIVAYNPRRLVGLLLGGRELVGRFAKNAYLKLRNRVMST
ncbi:MAG: GNAT family N-acetyltransferase [Parasulfuritortus sp.]|nr:GNAT family N-acetyltransferase [Parasulfuritortus sp.]